MKKRRQKRMLSLEQKQLIVDRVNSGESAPKVAREIGITPTQIYKWRKKLGGQTGEPTFLPEADCVTTNVREQLLAGPIQDIPDYRPSIESHDLISAFDKAARECEMIGMKDIEDQEAVFEAYEAARDALYLYIVKLEHGLY